MFDILHEFTIKAPRERVFEAMSSPTGLDQWWTKSSAGEPREGSEYTLLFGPSFDWRARVSRSVPGSIFELQMTQADSDWMDSRVGCELSDENSSGTRVRFHHSGWPTDNEHWRVSCFCWAMYLRVLRRYLEHGERVPYENRLDV
jgi:uncharacterized protein YndB with AHSA1/START domain